MKPESLLRFFRKRFLSIFFFSSCSIISFFFADCKNGGVDPPPTGIDTTSHNFTWDVQTIGVFQSSLSDVWGSSATDVWAVGRITDTISNFFPNAAHFNGSQWSLVQIGEGFNIFGISGFASNDIFAVGTNGRVYRWNGSQWQQVVCLGVGDGCSGLLSGEPLLAIWGTSPSSLFAVGDSGVIVHYNGQSWSKMQTGTKLTLRDVWGSSSNDVYSVGADFFGGQGILLHYDGTQWQPAQLETTSQTRLFGVWGLQSKVYGVGDFVYRFDGQNWSRIAIPDSNILKQKVTGVDLNDVFIGGDFGVALHWNGASWRRYDELSFNGTIQGIWSDGGDVYAVGWNSTLAVVIHGKRF